MKHDERFKITPVYINPRETTWEFLNQESAEPYSLRRVSGDSPEFDLVLTIDPYFGPHCKGAGYTRWTSRILYEEYGFTGIDTGEGLFKSSIYKRLWKMIVADENAKFKVQKYTGLPDNKFMYHHPCFDYIYQFSKRPSNRKRILWTPHCSVVSDPKYNRITGGHYSTFLTYADEMLSLFKKYNDVDFIVKIHPYLKERLDHSIKNKLVPYFDYDSWYKELTSLSNVISLSPETNYYQAFMDSDALLNDSISFILEYLVTNNPVLILRDRTSSEFSDYANDIIKNCYYEAVNKKEIESFIVKIRDNNDDEKKDKRSQYVDKLISKNTNNSKLVCDEIYNRLKDEMVI